MSNYIIGAAIGYIIGGIVGFMTAALCQASKNAHYTTIDEEETA